MASSAAPKAPHAFSSQKATYEWSGAYDAFGEIWKQLKLNPQPALLYAAVSIGLHVLDLVSHGSIKPGANGRQYASYESLASLAFMLALPTYGLALAKQRLITLNEFIDFSVRKYLYVLGVTILFVAILIVSILPLLIPLIWTVGWFSLAIMPVVDQGLDPVAALKESKRISAQHKGKVWGIVGFSILLSVPAIALSLVPVVGVAAVALFTCINVGLQAKLYLHLKEIAQAG